MENEITPQQVRDAALASRVTLAAFLKAANVPVSTFYHWERTKQPLKRRLTMLRLMDAVEGVK